MRIYEQIDALECMAVDPYKFLVAPKIVVADGGSSSMRSSSTSPLGGAPMRRE